VPYIGTYAYTGEVYGLQIQLHLTNSPTSTASDSQTVGGLHVTVSGLDVTIGGLDVTASGPTSAPSTDTSNSDHADSATSHGLKKKSGNIPKGAIVGIVVGVVAILILVGALLFLRRRKQAQQAKTTRTDSDALPEYVGSANSKSNHAYGPVPPKSPMEDTSERPTGLFQPQPTVVTSR
jgi:hypothetical protein